MNNWICLLLNFVFVYSTCGQVTSDFQYVVDITKNRDFPLRIEGNESLKIELSNNEDNKKGNKISLGNHKMKARQATFGGLDYDFNDYGRTDLGEADLEHTQKEESNLDVLERRAEQIEAKSKLFRKKSIPNDKVSNYNNKHAKKKNKPNAIDDKLDSLSYEQPEDNDYYDDDIPHIYKTSKDSKTNNDDFEHDITLVDTKLMDAEKSEVNLRRGVSRHQKRTKPSRNHKHLKVIKSLKSNRRLPGSEITYDYDMPQAYNRRKNANYPEMADYNEPTHDTWDNVENYPNSDRSMENKKKIKTRKWLGKAGYRSEDKDKFDIVNTNDDLDTLNKLFRHLSSQKISKKTLRNWAKQRNEREKRTARKVNKEKQEEVRKNMEKYRKKRNIDDLNDISSMENEIITSEDSEDLDKSTILMDNGHIFYNFMAPVMVYTGKLHKLKSLTEHHNRGDVVVIVAPPNEERNNFINKYAYYYQQHLEGSIVFVDCSSDRKIQTDFQNIVDVLYPKRTFTANDIYSAVFGYFYNRNVLFIFQNAKPGQFIFEELKNVLNWKNMKILISSEHLNWSGMHFQVIKLKDGTGSVQKRNSIYEQVEFLGDFVGNDKMNLEDSNYGYRDSYRGDVVYFI